LGGSIYEVRIRKLRVFLTCVIKEECAEGERVAGNEVHSS
jgi:hypothetical protein